MELVKDIVFSEDLEITGGDLKVAESDQQHVEHILKAQKGQYYQYPTLGIGIENNIKGSINKLELKREIRINLEKDNYNVNQIIIGEDIDELITSIDAIRVI